MKTEIVSRIRRGGGAMSGAAIVSAIDDELGSTAWQSGGGAGSWATATVDFGASYTDGGEFTITDAAVSPTSTVVAQFSGADSTADNTAEDHRFASMFMRLATVPAAGSFTLQAQAMVGLISRTMKVRYMVA